MDNWYLEQGGQKVGPMSLEAIQQMASAGKISPTDLVWCQGMANWQRADMQPWYAIASGPPPLSGVLSPAPAQKWGNLFKESAYNEPPPPSLIGWSIAVLLCCCLPGGVVGLVFHSKAQTEYARGNFDAARRAYDTGKNWLIGSAIVGFFFSIIYVWVKASSPGGFR